MGSSSGSRRGKGSSKSDSDDTFRQLEKDFDKLHNKAQKLITERVYLENEVASLKKKAVRLEEEVRQLKSTPLIIGFIQDILNENSAVVRSSNGTVFQVALNRMIEEEHLKPGTRVTLNQDTLAVVGVLHDAWDPLVTGAEMVERPTIKYSNIGGLDEQIQELREAIELPLQKPELFSKVGIEPPKGVLLIGPPGCGKTMIAKAVAAETKATFIRLVGSELAQKYIGEGGRMVRELFSLAKEKAPSIIFLDEIDAFGSKRLDSATSGDREVQRTLMQLLAELDGFDVLESVKIIAATNRPDILDDALLRPGRFDRIVEIPMPEDDARSAIFKIHTSKMATRRVNIKKLIEISKGFTGAEIKAACVEAGMIAIREERGHVTQSDFSTALQNIAKKRKKANESDAIGRLYG